MAWGLDTPTRTPASAAALGPAPESVEAIDIFEGVTPVTRVALEGVALLQIIKHCHESLPGGVAGSLLGVDNEQTLEVTNSFPSPPSSERKKGADEYQLDMMKSLREVGMDNNKVGWYQSVAMGTFCTASFIEHQFQYQKSLGPNAICLIYDSAETAKGSLSLRAVRLTKAFMDTYKSSSFTKESFAKTDIRSATVVEEIPIDIHNSDMITCWLQQSAQTDTTASFERLDLATNTYLESSLKNMTLWADELAQEHYKFQGYERALSKQRTAYQQWQNRQREENKTRRENGEEPVPEEDPNFFKSVNQPSRLESLLITKQMNTYCEHINRYAGKSFQKLFLAAKIHQNE
ncbi:Eukaryotic translation initiation factor 3 subunit H [Phytophthora megakarya]|uniref:Eukaryotic translation initiation factor 3 subunit H n=1 Tax=Phytophthora megakarya TaxID=4795 RepID=A0A225W2X4_9STRA|nr:Eukaryotic translation initiation factor 3 subunit H [Phytophthora megakarya]